MGTLYPYNAADICPVRELSVANKESTGGTRDCHVNLCWYVGRIRQTLDTLRRELSGQNCWERMTEIAGSANYTEDSMRKIETLELLAHSPLATWLKYGC